MADLTELKKVVDEIIGEEELVGLIDSGERINHYIGFEISGLVHVGQGLMTGLVIRELQRLGVHCRIYMADWHTWINNKLGGDRELIKEVAEGYFAPAIRAAAQIAGADPEKIEFIFGSELYDKNNRYWETVVEVSKSLTVSRMLKSTTILGREASESMDFAMLLYPAMQTADIFEMENQIAHAGTDQRNVHVIAREVAYKLKSHPLRNQSGEVIKPIAIHHTLVSGLNKPAQWPLPENIDKREMLTSLKMSKSVPGSAIFMNDSEEEIADKIRKAFCPEKETGYNPVLNWVRLMILPILGRLEIERPEKFGGNVAYDNFETLEADFASGALHPVDLKSGTTKALVSMLAPARNVFADKANLIAKIVDARSR
jgi:tyrosyl-tRNA synthetase